MLTIQPKINFISYTGYRTKESNNNGSHASGGQYNISKAASNAISNTQRGLIQAQYIRPLNKTAEASRFFGVDSRGNVDKQILNQLTLTILKTKEQNIVNFPNINMDAMEQSHVTKYRLRRHFHHFNETGVGRWTMRNNKGDIHTIGLIKYNDNIYVLDSLGYCYKNKEELQKSFASMFDENVIFSKKPQQKPDEYTCNNWTHANIDAVLEAIQEGKLNENNLDDILPNDINKVLRKQKRYVVENFGGKPISDLFNLKREAIDNPMRND